MVQAFTGLPLLRSVTFSRLSRAQRAKEVPAGSQASPAAKVDISLLVEPHTTPSGQSSSSSSSPNTTGSSHAVTSQPTPGAVPAALHQPQQRSSSHNPQQQQREQLQHHHQAPGQAYYPPSTYPIVPGPGLTYSLPVPVSSTETFSGQGGPPLLGIIPAQARKRGADGAQPVESPAKKQTKWSPEEDKLIVELRGKGMKWEDIAEQVPGRSTLACRLRYQNYLERRAEWDDEKKNKLARLYER